MGFYEKKRTEYIISVWGAGTLSHYTGFSPGLWRSFLFFGLWGTRQLSEVIVALSVLLVMVMVSFAASLYALKLVRVPMNEAVEAIKEISNGNLARRMKTGGFDAMEETFNALMDAHPGRHSTILRRLQKDLL